MAYFTREELNVLIPDQFLAQGLDDSGEGEQSGLYTKLSSFADGQVNAILGQRFDVPFTSNIPPIVPHAALIFALDALYMRRGYGTEANPNPVAARAKDMRAKLERIARGEEPLAPEASRSRPSVTAITETSRVYSPNGNAIS